MEGGYQHHPPLISPPYLYRRAATVPKLTPLLRIRGVTVGRIRLTALVTLAHAAPLASARGLGLLK